MRQTIIRQDAQIRQELLVTSVGYGNDVMAYYRKVVATWREKPRFDIQAKVTPDEISVFVIAAGLFAQRWEWLDKGTGLYGPFKAPYLIEPKGDYPLRFQSGHNAKTAPGGKYNQGDGRRFGDWVSTYAVLHPGIEPRDFSGTAAKDIQPNFPQRIESVLRRRTRR